MCLCWVMRNHFSDLFHRSDIVHNSELLITSVECPSSLNLIVRISHKIHMTERDRRASLNQLT